jgi:hypothetical protein
MTSAEAGIASNGSDITSETTRASAAEAATAAAVTSEAGSRAAADATLQGNVDAEATTRASADATLQGNIDSAVTDLAAEAAQRAIELVTTNSALDALEAEITTSLSVDISANTTAITAEATAARAAEAANASSLVSEATARTAADATLQSNIGNEATTRAAADAANATSTAAVATDLASEVSRASAAEAANATAISALINNTDPQALNSLAELVTAFEAADTDLTALVSANAAAITAEAASRATADNAATADRTAMRAEFATADAALQSAVDAEAGSRATADATLQSNIDAANTAVSNEASARASADTVLQGNVDAEATTRASADATLQSNIDAANAATAAEAVTARAAETANADALAAKTMLSLTDVDDSSFATKANFVMAVNGQEDGVELVDITTLSFMSQQRQTIDGDGAQTTFALDFQTNAGDSMVFVGGVIQDPSVHYTINEAQQSVTFVESIPTGTQAVVITASIGAVPENGSITPSKLSSDVKAYIQSSDMTAGTGGDVIDTFDATASRSAKYVIQVDNGAGEFETREALVLHDGTTAYITEYAMVYTGSSLLGDASVRMNGGNVELVYTANAAGTTVKVISTYMDV